MFLVHEEISNKNSKKKIINKIVSNYYELFITICCIIFLNYAHCFFKFNTELKHNTFRANCIVLTVSLAVDILVMIVEPPWKWVIIEALRVAIEKY